MRTSAEYKKSLNNGVVMTEMLMEALFSVNKRAKNYRDIERECREEYFGMYEEANRQKKEQFYGRKDKLLSCLKPTCIHREHLGYEGIRVDDDDPEYREKYNRALSMKAVVWRNSYTDRETYTKHSFFIYEDYTRPRYHYYLYYICGNATFHSPIQKEDLENYKNLEIVDLDGPLKTKGHDCSELMSVQFVDKIIKALEDGKAIYKKTLEDNPPIYAN